jgi:hypothetical protein
MYFILHAVLILLGFTWQLLVNPSVQHTVFSCYKKQGYKSASYRHQYRRASSYRPVSIESSHLTDPWTQPSVKYK